MSRFRFTFGYGKGRPKEIGVAEDGSVFNKFIVDFLITLNTRSVLIERIEDAP